VARIEGVGKAGFSIDANDYMDNSYNTMGLYAIELCADERPIFSDVMRELNFDLKRFINAHTDYPERMHSGRWFEKSFIMPGDTLPIYRKVADGGMVSFHAGSACRLSYYVRDKKDNESTLIFDINCPASGLPIPPMPKDSYAVYVPFNKQITFEQPGLKAVFPAYTFYQNMPLAFNVTPSHSKTSYSSVYQMGTPYFAVNSSFHLSIQAEDLPPDLIAKAFISSATKGYQGGIYNDGWVTADVLTLGKFFITTDTRPPVLTPINIRSGRNMANEKMIAFKMADDIAGVDTFDGYVDGHWVLFQYDPRIRTIFYVFDEHVSPGTHELTMKITDRVHNLTVQKYSFYR
jgi:hypothetical protein